MDTLYIIGNGFDIYHGLPTTYADFHQYISGYNPELEDQLEEYFRLGTGKNYLWKDFEADLATFCYKSFFDAHDNSDTLSESYKPSDAFGVQDEITEEAERLVSNLQEAFREWVEGIEIHEEVPSSIKPLEFSKTAKFLNFNYTATLEILYQIPREQILYIHNKAEE